MSLLARNWPLVFAAVVILALAVLVYLVVLLFRSARGTGFEEAGEAPPAAPPEASAASAPAAHLLGRSFRRAASRLRRFVAGAQPVQQLPWFALLGAEGSRSAGLLGRAGLDLPFGPPGEAGGERGSGCDFWFLERGIVLEVAGELLLRQDGATSDDWGWRTFLRLLQRYRPHRPLDGVVLTLSAAELLRAATGGMAAQVDLERRANLLYRKLWQAQRQLGLRLPVYVLVTGAEAIPGFAGLCAVLPPARRHDILGWSNPSSIDAAYRPGWVEEAFAALDGRLAELQMELFAGRPLAGAADEVFRFPGSLAPLAAPVRTVLDQLFKPSGYHESFLLRGIYLCGETSGPIGDPEVHFLAALLEHKVFREKNLAGPTRAALAGKSRRVLAAQAALVLLAVVLAAGTVVGYRRLDLARDELRPFLEEQAREQADLVRQTGPDGEVPPAVLQKAATHLLAGASRLDFDHFSSFFLPASWPWFTSFDDRLTRAAIDAYDEVVFEAMYLRLKERAQELGEDPYRPPDRFIAWEGGMGPLSAEPPTALAVPAVERTAEFVSLARLVQALAALEDQVELYNGLPATQDIEELARLIDYLFGVQMPKASARHAHLYRRCLKEVEYEAFKAEAFRPAATAKVETLAQSLNARLFRDSELLEALEELASSLDRLPLDAAETPDPAMLALLIEEVERVEEALARPELDWARHTQFDLGPAYTRVLAGIEASTFLGPQVARAVRQAGEAGFLQFRHRLAEFSAPAVGTLLEIDDGEARLQLGSQTLLLKAALSSFLSESFVRSREAQSFATRVPPGTLLAWDLHVLSQGATLEEDFERFQGRILPLFPEAWRRLVAESARQAMEARIADLVGRAQGFRSEPVGVSALLRERELAAAIDSFGAAIEPLNQLMDLASRLRLGRLEQDLADLVGEQGFALLAGVEDLLAAGSPYAPRDGSFSWWDGVAPVSLAAYDAADPAALAAYLELERRRIAHLATEYAEPLVTWLGESGRARQPEYRGLFLRWEGILLSLKDHEAKKPGNPVAVLEEFITKDLSEATPGRCLPSPVPSTLTGASSNYFLARRAELARQLLAACSTLAVARAESAYDEVARFFNDRLAGRFPFAEAPPGAFTGQADLADVREFYRRFDASAPALAAVEKESSAFGGAGSTVAEFYRKAAAARGFFAPYLDSPEPEPPFEVEVEAEFRVNRPDAAAAAGAPVSPEVELGGERIIGWELAVGDKRVTHRDADRRLTWRPGLPVRLALRWAEDAPRLPSRPFLAADGRTVIYEYTDRWSLVSLVLSHPSADPRRHTLRFLVVTEPNPAVPGGPEAEPPTRAFVRLALRAPAREGKPGPVLALPRFPTAAPLPGVRTASR